MITLKIALLFFAVVAIIAAAIVILWQREIREYSPARQVRATEMLASAIESNRAKAAKLRLVVDNTGVAS